MKRLIEIITSALCGMSATGPMTVWMILLHRWLPESDKHALPPREITRKLAKEAHLEHRMDEETLTGLTLINHFAYGGAAGAVYGAVFKNLPGPQLAKGVIFGLIVWTGSYLGLLPAAKILKPATEHTASRNGLMIVVHIIWGLALGLMTKVLMDDTKRSSSALLGNSPVSDKDVRK